MSESIAARRWLHATLNGLAPGGAHHGVAPASATYPFITYQMLSAGTDRTGMTLWRIWSDPLYLVKVVTEGGITDAVVAIVDAIDTALHAASGTASGGLIITAWRERLHDLPEYTDGLMIQNIGGEYRILIQGA